MRKRKSSFRKEGEKFYYKLSTCFIEIPKKRKCAGTLSETISRSLGKPASQLISFVRMYSGPCCFSHTALSLYHFLSEAYISLLWHKHMTINSHIYILEFIQSQFKNPQKLFRAHEPHFQTPGKKFMSSSLSQKPTLQYYFISASLSDPCFVGHFSNKAASYIFSKESKMSNKPIRSYWISS